MTATRTIPTEDLKLVAYACPDVLNIGDSFEVIVQHEPCKGAAAEYDLWAKSFDPKSVRRCDYCGHKLKYNCIVQHTPTQEFYNIGRECFGNIQFLQNHEYAIKAKFDEAAKRVAARTKPQREARAADIRLTRYAESRPAVAAALESGHSFDMSNPVAYMVAKPVEILKDLRAKVRKYGSLSEKQEAFALNLQKQIQEKLAGAAEKLAKREEQIAGGLRAPSGRVSVTGTIISIKVKESHFGTSYKVLLDLGNGTRAYGTIPNMARSQVARLSTGAACFDAERGDEVEVKATFEVSDKDPLFAFFSRPIFRNIGLENRIKQIIANDQVAA